MRDREIKVLLRKRSSCSSAKSVSFGNDAVKTFIYDKESEEATPIIQKEPFTDPSAPVARVRVTSNEVHPESPSPIAPPTQMDDFRAVSPPLPTKKGADYENPFRPEEELFHEVDPIVEQYMHKPFPASRPGSAQTTPIKGNGADYLQNGLSKEQLLASEKKLEEIESPQKSSKPTESSRTEEDRRRSSADKQPIAVNYKDDLPPAGKVELIHVKKKKCGCCSLQ